MKTLEQTIDDFEFDRTESEVSRVAKEYSALLNHKLIVIDFEYTESNFIVTVFKQDGSILFIYSGDSLTSIYENMNNDRQKELWKTADKE